MIWLSQMSFRIADKLVNKRDWINTDSIDNETFFGNAVGLGSVDRNDEAVLGDDDGRCVGFLCMQIKHCHAEQEYNQYLS